MSDFPAHVILDADGNPIGVYRENQDPSEPTRLHPVPRTNAFGEPITEQVYVGLDPEGEAIFAEQAVVAMLPIDDPRVTAQLEAEGLKLEGTVLVSADPDTVVDVVEE